MDEDYYTIDEVADHLKVTRKTVYDWMRTGELPYVQVGSRRRITGSALKAFLGQGKPEELSEETDETFSPMLAVA